MGSDGRSSADPSNDVRVERRRPRQADQSPADTLRELPALVVLERIPIPVLAIGPDGMIVFVNSAFATMLGHTQDALVGLEFHSIFYNLPNIQPVVTVMRAYANELVELVHRDGFIVQASMSKSAMARHDDEVVLATFHDLTDQLWDDGQ